MPCCGKFVHKRCFTKARENSIQCGHCRIETNDSDDTLSVGSNIELRANESLDDSSSDNPIWQMPPKLRGPTQIEQARNAMADLRASAAAHLHHQPNTPSWRRLPHHVNATVWFLFWVNLDWFISTNAGPPLPLYVHGYVYTPIPPVPRVRKTMYRLFNHFIPPEVQPCLSFVRYRLRFYHIPELFQQRNFVYPYDANEVNVTHLRFTRFWTPPRPER